MKPMTLTVVVFGTSGYLKLAERLLDSLFAAKPAHVKLHALVFTDRPDDTKYEAVRIPHSPWPGVTERRYGDIVANAYQIRSGRVVMLDADTRLVHDKWPGFLSAGYDKPLIAAQHWQDSAITGELAPYCRDNRCRAFVGDMKLPQHYVQGAFVGGERDVLVHTLHHLATDIAFDKSQNVTAVWNEESYWNKFVRNNPDKVHTISYGELQASLVASDKDGKTGDQLRR